MNISINNSLSIRGYAVSVQVSRIDQSHFTANGAYFDRGSEESSIAKQLVELSHGDASITMLRRAIATVGDMFAPEHTLRRIDALVKEFFWHQLNLQAEVEFQVISTGHGIVNDPNVKLLVKTPAREEVA